MSARPAAPSPAWGPERRRAAVAVTFDNLGEATELQRGQWPADAPLGRHASVTHALPRVLEVLSQASSPATFFVEGLNAQLYPQALRAIDAAGHKVAYHGWCHEVWAELSEASERELLARGRDALAALGLRPAGFRPPGGTLGAGSERALAELGFTYCSPAGSGAGMRGGLALLPFDWTVIDAFHYLPHFAARRRAARGRPEVLPPAVLQAKLTHTLHETVRQGRLLVAIFHPFLSEADERLDVLRAFVREVSSLVDAERVWCRPLREVAAWLAEEWGDDGGEVVLDAE